MQSLLITTSLQLLHKLRYAAAAACLAWSLPDDILAWALRHLATIYTLLHILAPAGMGQVIAFILISFALAVLMSVFWLLPERQSVP